MILLFDGALTSTHYPEENLLGGVLSLEIAGKREHNDRPIDLPSLSTFVFT